MDKSFYLEGDIDEGKVKDCISFFNENEGDLVIYLDSEGGGYVFGKILLDLFMENKERMILKAAGMIGSCAFHLFFLFDGKKELMQHVVGAYHFAYAKFEVDCRGEIYGEDARNHMKEMMKLSDWQLDFCKKLGLNEDELKTICDSKDVYFSEDRLKEFLKINNN